MMIERYESMRRSALEGGGSPVNAGLGLFLERGMAAWLRLWSSLPEPLRNMRNENQQIFQARIENTVEPGEVLKSASAQELTLVMTEIMMRQLRGIPCRA